MLMLMSRFIVARVVASPLGLVQDGKLVLVIMIHSLLLSWARRLATPLLHEVTVFATVVMTFIWLVLRISMMKDRRLLLCLGVLLAIGSMSIISLLSLKKSRLDVIL